ncbi:MAG: MarR family transcriptional regulator [Christensenellales bacterium]
MLALSEKLRLVASKDVAQLLGVKRPTIHRSLQVLQEKGLIHKELYGEYT